MLEFIPGVRHHDGRVWLDSPKIQDYVLTGNILWELIWVYAVLVNFFWWWILLQAFYPKFWNFRLVEEVHEIGDTLEQLQAKMAEVEKALKQLQQMRQTLEYDLSVKNNSIHVDRELCLSWRKSFDMSPRRTVYYWSIPIYRTDYVVVVVSLRAFWLTD